MKTIIRRVALVGLIYIFASTAYTAATLKWGAPQGRMPQVIADIVIGSFLVVQVWRRPRTWGFGVGILLLLTLPLHYYLWHKGVTSPTLDKTGLDTRLGTFILGEIPQLITAICCIMLGWQFPPTATNAIRKQN